MPEESLPPGSAPSTGASASETTLAEIKNMLSSLTTRVKGLEGGSSVLPEAARKARAEETFAWTKESTKRQYKEVLRTAEIAEASGKKMRGALQEIESGTPPDLEAIHALLADLLALNEQLSEQLYARMKDTQIGDRYGWDAVLH